MNQYQLKGTSIVFEVIGILAWDVVAKHIDNGKVDTYPIQYFKEFFISLEETPTKTKNDEQQEEFYASLKEDVEAELKAKYNLQLDQVNDVLLINKFKERYMKDSQQFDYFEPEEIAHEFYEAYQNEENDE